MNINLKLRNLVVEIIISAEDFKKSICKVYNLIWLLLSYCEVVLVLVVSSGLGNWCNLFRGLRGGVRHGLVDEVELLGEEETGFSSRVVLLSSSMSATKKFRSTPTVTNQFLHKCFFISKTMISQAKWSQIKF